MTWEEFLEALSKTPRDWQFFGNKERKNIRRGSVLGYCNEDSQCPISSLLNQPSMLYLKASMDLDIGGDLRIRILQAADDAPFGPSEDRLAILQACGLNPSATTSIRSLKPPEVLVPPRVYDREAVMHTVRIDVTKEDIAASDASRQEVKTPRCETCAIARAISRVLGTRCVWFYWTGSTRQFWGDRDLQVPGVDVDRVVDFVRVHDLNKGVSPISFDLEVHALGEVA